VIHQSKNFAFKIQKLIYFHKRPVLFKFQKKNQQVCFLEIDLFSWVTCLLWNSKVGLFTRATCPFQFSKRTSASVCIPWKWPIFTSIMLFSNFSKHPCFFEVDVFSRATSTFQISKRISANVHTSLKLIYFHERPAHFEIQKLAYFIGDLSILKFKN
jgi:hypothetical protein